MVARKVLLEKISDDAEKKTNKVGPDRLIIIIPKNMNSSPEQRRQEELQYYAFSSRLRRDISHSNNGSIFRFDPFPLMTHLFVHLVIHCRHALQVLREIIVIFQQYYHPTALPVVGLVA